MDYMTLNTPNNNEVVTFDFTANKVCGEKLSKDDAIQICKVVGDIANKGSVITGFYLLALKEKADLSELGYANIYDLAREQFGLSKGVVSERIQVAQRFRSDDMSVYALDEKWKNYKYTALLNMRKMTNEEIEAAQITATTQAIDIKALVDNKKTEEKTEEKKSEEKKSEEKTESSESEPTENVSRETSEEATENEFANIVELNASELNASLRASLDKYMRAHNIDTHAILQINMDK